MKRLQRVALPIVVLSGLVGCGTPRVQQAPASPQDISITRSYGWDTEVADPQASWSPDDYRLVVRDNGGFAILSGNDGTTPPDLYRSTENRQSYFPTWLDDNNIIFGAQHNVEKLADGRVVPSAQGLTVVTIGARPQQRQYSAVGVRPRLGQGLVYVQSAERILTIDATGAVQEFGLGFYAEPQVQGTGVAWQETPIFETDWWTGKALRSALVVHWNKKAVDLVPNAVQPHWSMNGGLAATVLRSDPVAGVSWWRAGTDVVYIPGPGKSPTVICTDARDPAPDPVQPLIAVSTLAGTVVVLSQDGRQRFEVGPGCNPQWSYDGTRLALEDAPSDQPKSTNHITVYVLAIRPGSPVAAK